MSDFVLDCSVAAAWFFKDEADAYCNSVLDSLANSTAWVPELWPFEIANAFLVAEKRKRISLLNRTQAVSELKSLPIRISREEVDIANLIDFAKAHSLSSYDASYLALAKRKNLPLSSKDAQLMRVAKKLGVHLFVV